MSTFDQKYTHARAQMEGGDWSLRADIADQAATIAALREKLQGLTEQAEHMANMRKLGQEMLEMDFSILATYTDAARALLASLE
jgi:hypothetical protein